LGLRDGLPGAGLSRGAGPLTLLVYCATGLTAYGGCPWCGLGCGGFNRVAGLTRMLLKPTYHSFRLPDLPSVATTVATPLATVKPRQIKGFKTIVAVAIRGR
jgi:hypothetical protein